MNFGLSTLVGVCLFVIPGFLFLWGQSKKAGIPPAFSINRELFLAIVISSVTHVAFIASLSLCPFLPDVDLGELYAILVGTNSYHPDEYFPRSASLFALYVLADYSGCLLLGYLLAKSRINWLRLELLPARTGASKFLTAGENRVWCVVDILTKSKVLYRGVYHSLSAPDPFCPNPAINLIFASRWYGKSPLFPSARPAPGPRQRLQPKDQKEGEYRDIKCIIGLEELEEMVRTSFEWDGTPYARKLKLLMENPDELDAFLSHWINKSPDIQVMWSDILNINIRHFEL